MKNFEIRDLKMLFPKRNSEVNIFFKSLFHLHVGNGFWRVKVSHKDRTLGSDLPTNPPLAPRCWVPVRSTCTSPHLWAQHTAARPCFDVSVVLHIHCVCVRCSGLPWAGGGWCVLACPWCRTTAFTGHFEQENVTPASPDTTDVRNVRGELKAQWQKTEVFCCVN